LLFFLPAPGRRWESELGAQGATGYYWSSTETNFHVAAYLAFANGISIVTDGVPGSNGHKAHAHSIRCVRKSKRIDE